MIKLTISAVITTLLGIISLVWVIYDYIALADITYNYGMDPTPKQHSVTLGFIPIILFHVAFFVTMYFLFAFLKEHKGLSKEYKKEHLELENYRIEKEKQDKNKNPLI